MPSARPPCPFGTDIEGAALQHDCQNKYARHPTKPLFEIAPFAMGAGFTDVASGHNPTEDRRKDEYAVINPTVGDAPNDSLSFFMENMKSYGDHKARTNKTEAAVTIFPLGKPPKTRQKKKREAPPPTEDEKADMRACYDASRDFYENYRRHARDDHVKHVPLPPKPPATVPRSTVRNRGLDVEMMMGKVDRFKHFRNREIKIDHVDALAGASKCGAEPWKAADTVAIYGYARSKREGLKKSNQLSDDTRAAIFGY